MSRFQAFFETGESPGKRLLVDPGILKNAPEEMIRAGYGDVIGKFSALNDWKLAHAVNGEYFCPWIYDAGILPGPFGYVIEGRLPGGEWTALADLRDNREDLAIDYRVFPPVCCRELRLRITGTPAGITPGVISFAVFGTRKHNA